MPGLWWTIRNYEPTKNVAVTLIFGRCCRTGRMAGGPQSVGKRSGLIVRLSLTIGRRSLPIGDQSLTILWRLATEVGDWSWTISDRQLLKTSENLTLSTENHCTAFADRKRLFKDYWKPLYDQMIAERSYISHRSAFSSPKVNKTVVQWSATSTRLLWVVGNQSYTQCDWGIRYIFWEMYCW